MSHAYSFDVLVASFNATNSNRDHTSEDARTEELSQ
jgi:hypothetical protein